MMRPVFWMPFLILLMTGCERDIEFKLDDASAKLVVEATIENDRPPLVVLTRSVGFFSNLSLPVLAQTFVNNADVFVSNGTLTHKLKEYTVTLAPGINFYYYSIDSTNLSTAFLGQFNTSYTLKVIASGQEYNASTTIPSITRQIDSVWWKPVVGTSDSTKALVMVKATDPPGYGDYIRYFTSINNGPFLPGERSVWDDLFIDGTTYEIQVEPGFDRNDPKAEKEFFSRGDTINFKLSNIDKGTFDFWRTWEFSIQSIGNPFSTPIKVLGNISNGALGYFGGYASQYRTLIIPQ
jgi:hypothetical protein